MLNLAIIGAGVGGCSAAYFAQKHLPSSKVTVYEMDNRIGGRVFTFRENDVLNELGATFFNPNNKIVCSLVNKIGLEVKNLLDQMDIAVWNGTEIVFRSKQSKFYSMLNLFSNYKLNVPKLLLVLKAAHKKIMKLYDKEEPLELEEFFERLGLDYWYKRPFDEILIEMGMNGRFIDEIVTPITRIIYSQNAELGGFAGLSSLLGVYAKTMYALKDGNDVLPTKLLEKSTSTIKLEHKVNRIEKKSNGSFYVQVGDDLKIYDAIVVATPIELSGIRFEGLTYPMHHKCEFQKIHVRLMKGELNLRYFNLDTSKNLPSIVLTSREADPITRFSINKLKDGSSLVALTSTKSIKENLLGDLFVQGKLVLDHTWNAAYPIFKPIKTIPPTCIDDGLVYVNAISSAVSSLETTAFSALNCIKLLKNQLNR